MRCKIEHLELENKKLKEENTKLKSHNYNFDNVSESRDEFRAATGLTKTVVTLSFMILQADYHKAVMTLKVPNSGPKPKLPSQDQLFMYMTWLKN